MKNTLLFKYAFLAALSCNLGFADSFSHHKIDTYWANCKKYPKRIDPAALKEAKKLFQQEKQNKQEIKIFLPCGSFCDKYDTSTSFFKIFTPDKMKLSGEGKTFYIKDASIVGREPRKNTSISFPILKINLSEEEPVIIPYKFLPNCDNELKQLFKNKENKRLHKLIVLEYSNIFGNHDIFSKYFCNRPLPPAPSFDKTFVYKVISKLKRNTPRPLRFPELLLLKQSILSVCLADNQWGFNGIADEDREKIINATPFLDKLKDGTKIFRKDAIYPYGELRISGK